MPIRAIAYIVKGTSGEYEDYRTWNVKGYYKKADAEKRIEKLDRNWERLDVNGQKARFAEGFDSDSSECWEKESERQRDAEETFRNRYDKNFPGGSDRPRYTIEELEVT